MAVPRYDAKGWYVDNTEGIPTIYLSIVDEGYTTRPGDTPSNTGFKPRILNPESFSVRKRPSFWPIDGHGQRDDASFGELQIDNQDGAFDFLLRADLRDADIVLKLPKAQAYADAGALAATPAMVTAILDNAKSSDEDVITLTLRDTITRNDKLASVRRFPPFVDSGVALRSLPVLLGACYNVSPPAVDAVNRIFQLSDVAVTNVTAVRDRGALLDVNATPPQYYPAENATCIQLQTDPVGKLTVDCSSVGAQSPIPGSADILGGAGILTTWPSAGSPPTGWTYGNPTYGTITRWDQNNSIQNFVASIATRRRYDPATSSFGQYMYYPANLQPGKTYRISIKLVRTMGNNQQAGGLLVRTDLTANGNGSVSGPIPLTQPVWDAQDYTFTYTVPAGAARNIYVIGVGDPGYAADFITQWCGLKIQELGQFLELPMEGISLADYVREILVNRGNDTSAPYSATDAQAIDSAAGYTIGRYFSEAPNRLDALQEALDSYCAGKFTDSTGTIRFTRLEDPRLLTPTFDLDETVIDRSVEMATCDAEYLTNRLGVRRNWSPSSDSDFVTDEVGLPVEMRERFKRTSQFERTSTFTPAGHYAHAIGAPAFDCLIHDVDAGQAEIDRVMKLFSPQVYSDGSVSTGRRTILRLSCRFDDPESFGATLKIPARTVQPGSVGRVTYADRGLSSVPFYVLGTAVYPFGGRIELEVLI